MARKMMAPKSRYFGTEEERAEIAVKYLHGECLTLDECSKVNGLSRSAIKAIETRALAKCRMALQRKFGKNVSLADLLNLDKSREDATRI